MALAALVALAIVAAIGLGAVVGLLLGRRRTAALGLVAFIGIGGVFLLAATRAAREPTVLENTRAQVELLHNLRRPGDVVLVSSMAAYPFAYYWPQQPRFEPGPPSVAVRFHVAYPGDPSLVVAKERTRKSVHAAMERLPPGTRRAWILLLHEDTHIPDWASEVTRHGGRLLADPRYPCAAFSPAELARAGLLVGRCPLLVGFEHPPEHRH